MRNLYQSWQQGWKSKFGIDFDDFDARASKSSKFFIKIDLNLKSNYQGTVISFREDNGRAMIHAGRVEPLKQPEV